MDKKKSFILFAPEFLALSNHLNNRQRGELITAICETVMYGEPVRAVSEDLAKAYDFLISSITDNFQRYNEVCEKRRAIAQKAASKRKANAEQKQNNNTAIAPLNDNDHDNVNDMKNKNEDNFKEKKNKKENHPLITPTLEDVKIYCAVRGFKNISPQAFYDYYEARDWKTGNKPITDWQTKLIKWAKGKSQETSTFASLGDCVRLPSITRQGEVQ